ncbi:MAG: transglutaminase domain-containing protein [Lachnospiraceae bacterium]|nr:transglutaminase domain-containing protein [Lachnospiraceae bacterium]
MRKTALFFTTLVLSFLFSMEVFAIAFTTTPVSKMMYTTENTQVYTQPDNTLVPVLAAGSGIPVQVTGITSNGWYQIDVSGVYYVPGNELTDTDQPALTSSVPGVIPINRTYQTAVSATVNSEDEMQSLVDQALDMHVYTLSINSRANIFSSTANYIQSLLAGQNGDYSTHSCNGYHLNREKNNYTITFEYLATIEEDQASDAYVQQTAGNLIGGSTKETIRRVHDYICNLTGYSNETVANVADFRSPYDAIVSHQTVCTGYALLFQRYMDALGIPCTTAAGIRNGGPHMWNIVNVDGQWYHIDCTWDDQAAYISNRWFLCGADTAGYSTWGSLTLAPDSLK